MNVVEIIRAKRDGHRIPEAALRGLVADYARGDVPDYQMAALLMAIYFRGLHPDELGPFTDAMLHSGAVLDWSGLDGLPSRPVDKHSTGGVGDKISVPLAPAVAACGGVVPMISGRGLGHTGGTLDKLESIPGFRTRIDEGEARQLIARLGLAMMGQTERICPADRRLYALRDVTSTVDSVPLIAASIMSKKLAEGISGLVLDVKYGSGAFMKDLEDARTLARTLVGIGERCGCRTVAWITRMDRPLGRAVGNALEIAESVEVLRGGGPADVRALTTRLGGEMLWLGGVCDSPEAGERAIEAALDDGRALARFRQMVEAQGGDPGVADDLGRLPAAARQAELRAPVAGFVQAIDSEAVGRAGVALGAGRLKTDDAIDPAVGFEILRTVGDAVQAQEPLIRIHYSDDARLRACLERLEPALRIGATAPEAIPLFAERISA